MTEGRFLYAGAHRVRLKWHRAQRAATDTPFTRARLVEGFSSGAVMEVDLRLSREGDCVCLHDATLDRETTGSGPVAAATTAAIRALRMRDPDGEATAEPVLLLADLAALAAGGHPEAQLQLDLKDRLPVVDRNAADRLGATLGAVAPRFTVSGHDWEAVKLLGASAPGIRLGFDPCDRPEVASLRRAEDFAAFVRMTEAIAPEAAILYMQHRILLAGLQAGCDMIAAFHDGGREVDAWTMKIDQPDLARDLRLLVAARVDQITTGEPIAFEELWAGPGRAQGRAGAGGGRPYHSGIDPRALRGRS
jgi:glycerophosphoryl diester phosphodiesterase